jgi:hypothetical protein
MRGRIIGGREVDIRGRLIGGGVFPTVPVVS